MSESDLELKKLKDKTLLLYKSQLVDKKEAEAAKIKRKEHIDFYKKKLAEEQAKLAKIKEEKEEILKKENLLHEIIDDLRSALNSAEKKDREKTQQDQELIQSNEKLLNDLYKQVGMRKMDIDTKTEISMLNPPIGRNSPINRFFPMAAKGNSLLQNEQPPSSPVSFVSSTPRSARKVYKEKDPVTVIDLTLSNSEDRNEEAVTPDYNSPPPQKAPKFAIIYNQIMQQHIPPSLNEASDKPRRLTAVFNKLEDENFTSRSNVVVSEGRKATNGEILLCHDQSYIDIVNNTIKTNQKFKTLDEEGKVIDDSDMFYSAKSLDAIYYAAGCSAELADMFLRGEITKGFAIVRPPGHHASHNQHAGFCFFNNAAICAVKLANAGKKVLIVDYDIHLGDGTMDILAQPRESNSLLRYYSIHRWDKGEFYPKSQLGQSTAPNQDLRITLLGFNLPPAPTGKQTDEQKKAEDQKWNDFYTNAFKNRFDANIFKWKPDVIVVSAGFDSVRGDLGECSVTEEGYRNMTKLMYKYCPNILMVLEGGYVQKRLAECAFAAVDTLEKLPRE